MIRGRAAGRDLRSKDGTRVYVHVLDNGASQVILPGTAGKLAMARSLHCGKVAAEAQGASPVLYLPPAVPDAVDAIVVLDAVKK